MERRFGAMVLILGGILLAYFFWCAGTPKGMLNATALADVPPPPPHRSAPATTVDGQVAALEKELQAIKRNGVFLGLSQVGPATPKASDEELDVLRTLVEERLATWRKIHAFYVKGIKGGEKQKETQARFWLYLSLARLAWAENRDAAALAYLQRAVVAADDMVKAVQAAYDVGTITLDVVLDSQKMKAHIEEILLHAGGTLPNPKAKRTTPWTLPEGPMPDDDAERSQKP
jgi:hypothetical protein